MLMCLKDHGEDPTAEIHYHKSVRIIIPQLLMLVSCTQTIRTCSCSEGKAIIQLVMNYTLCYVNRIM